MKIFIAIAFVAFALIGNEVYACTTCNKPLQNAIFNERFLSNLLMLAAPFPILGLGVAALSTFAGGVSNAGRDDLETLQSDNNTRITAGPMIAAATIIGVGMGAFVDGIVLHQILQWHQMVSNMTPPITLEAQSVNMFWDGIFSAFCWITTFVGIMMLWRIRNRTDVVRNNDILWGGLIFGFGLFNVVEGIIDHHLLGLHNVREADQNHNIANYVFLGFSMVLLAIGWLLIGNGKAKARVQLG